MGAQGPAGFPVVEEDSSLRDGGVALTPLARQVAGRAHLPRGRVPGPGQRRGALSPRFAVRGVCLVSCCWPSRHAVSDNVTSLGLTETLEMIKSNFHIT